MYEIKALFILYRINLQIYVNSCNHKCKLHVFLLATKTYPVMKVLLDSPLSVRYGSNASSYQQETGLMVSGYILYNHVLRTDYTCNNDGGKSECGHSENGVLVII